MSILLISEHNNKEVRPFTYNAITAASLIDQDVHALVVGSNCETVAQAIAKSPLVKKVLHIDDQKYENNVAENIAPIVSSSSNWQGIVSLSCLIVGLVLSWPFLIPGLVFGILGIIGDKERKWMGWVGMIANAVYLLLVLAVIGATV